jgi:hypothetical protein
MAPSGALSVSLLVRSVRGKTYLRVELTGRQLLHQQLNFMLHR